MIATQLNSRYYSLSTGGQIQREHGPHPIEGHALDGRWVMRDQAGGYVDADYYIDEIAKRQKVSFA